MLWHPLCLRKTSSVRGLSYSSPHLGTVSQQSLKEPSTLSAYASLRTFQMTDSMPKLQQKIRLFRYSHLFQKNLAKCETADGGQVCTSQILKGSIQAASRMTSMIIPASWKLAVQSISIHVYPFPRTSERVKFIEWNRFGVCSLEPWAFDTCFTIDANRSICTWTNFRRSTANKMCLDVGHWFISWNPKHEHWKLLTFHQSRFVYRAAVWPWRIQLSMLCWTQSIWWFIRQHLLQLSAQVRRSATRTCSCFSWTKVVNSSTSTRREQIDLRHDMAYDTIIQILYGLAWYLYERRVQFPRWSENRLCILEQKLAEHKRFAFWICPKEKWTSLMGKCEGPWPNLYKYHMFCFFFFWTFPQVDWDGLGLRLPFWTSIFHTSHGPIV